jgi:phosphatidylglycerophosphate synthase
MFDDSVRPFVARLLGPAGRVLAAWGVTPACITWTGFAIAGAGAVAITSGLPRLGLALWLVSRLADGLDGVVAREGGRQSALGGYLDITLDMAAYSLMVLAFAHVHPAPPLLWQAILTGYVLAITTTLALSSAAERSARTLAAGDRSFQFTRGLAEAGETSVVYALWVVFPSLVVPVGWIWCVLLFATAVQRSWLAYRLLPGADAP